MLPNRSTTTTDAFPLDAFTVAVTKMLELIVKGTEKPWIFTKDVFPRLVPVMLIRVLVVPVRGEMLLTAGF